LFSLRLISATTVYKHSR